MGKKKYMTEEEREEARRLQNKLAQRAYRERYACKRSVAGAVPFNADRYAGRNAKKTLLRASILTDGELKNEQRGE